MAKLEIGPYDGPDSLYESRVQIKATLSRRNLLALLHKLDMEGSHRRIENNVVEVEGAFSDEFVLVVCCEDDEEHYADPVRLGSKPGPMHPETEAHILSMSRDE